MPSVTSCTLSRQQPASTRDELGRWTHQLTFDVVTDGVMDRAALVEGAESSSPNAFPAYGATWSFAGETDSNIYHYQTQVEGHPDTLTRYTATAIFAPLPDDTDVTIFEPNPFLRGPTCWFDREVLNKFFDRDVNGNPVVNTAGQQYDVPVEKQVHRGVLVTEFNVATLAEVAALLEYNDAVNVSPWTILGSTFGSRVAWCQDAASGPPVKQGAYTFFPVQMRFAFNTETWDEPLIERGTSCRQRDRNGDFMTKTVYDEDGDAHQVPELFPFEDGETKNLAADGTRALDGQEAIVTNWRLYKELNFNALPFSG